MAVNRLMVRYAAMIAIGVLPGAVFATEASKDETRIEKRHVTIIKRGEGGKPIDDAHVHMMAAKCDAEGQKLGTDVQTEADGKKQRTKIVICGKSDTDIVAALEKARGEIAGEDGLNLAHRTKALATLDAEIARLKAARPNAE